MIVVFDLDGCLANIEHRLHHIRGPGRANWDGFFEACVHDKPIWPVLAVIQSMIKSDHWVEIWSGRSELVRPQTTEWLVAHGVLPYDGSRTSPDPKVDARLGYRRIRMREHRDNTPDHVLKERWFDELAPEWRPEIVFDDRRRLVDMWRSKGIICAQVAPGEF